MEERKNGTNNDKHTYDRQLTLLIIIDQIRSQHFINWSIHRDRVVLTEASLSLHNQLVTWGGAGKLVCIPIIVDLSNEIPDNRIDYNLEDQYQFYPFIAFYFSHY